MIKLEKGHQESAQDKKSIANIENVIAEIEEEQENKENPPTLLFDDIPDDGYKKLRKDLMYQATNICERFFGKITFQLMVSEPLYLIDCTIIINKINPIIMQTIGKSNK